MRATQPQARCVRQILQRVSPTLRMRQATYARPTQIPASRTQRSPRQVSSTRPTQAQAPSTELIRRRARSGKRLDRPSGMRWGLHRLAVRVAISFGKERSRSGRRRAILLGTCGKCRKEGVALPTGAYAFSRGHVNSTDWRRHLMGGQLGPF